jgi:hypothetical protein
MGSNRDNVTILRTESPTALDDIEQQRNSHPLIRTETDDTTRNPFRDSTAATSDAALVSPTSADPFKSDITTKEHRRTDSTSTVTGGTGGVTAIQPVPQRPLQDMGSSFLAEDQGRTNIPAPRSLDLPTTPGPQHMYAGGRAIPARMSGPGEGMRIRRTLAEAQEEEEEVERERREGRWWTDWLCGLKEKKDPGGQVSLLQSSRAPVMLRLPAHVASFLKLSLLQDGRTNPFE